jgi:hypothetical protein
VPESLASAQYVREVKVYPAALAAVAIRILLG